ncbi:hypothetical protein M408DRAFT_327652 [Serendipita vermifera MAFF 305830]|uniref:Uncharacterized protein n=1 Tax=Serendipita vermifera MAFF 305830 TaxID=933852 RepID=A0A0C3BIU8_SERVB|nr:hypothetical protein M408DRAFT_327652 [Serendipita vermifera MAFF 305830]
MKGGAIYHHLHALKGTLASSPSNISKFKGESKVCSVLNATELQYPSPQSSLNLFLDHSALLPNSTSN